MKLIQDVNKEDSWNSKDDVSIYDTFSYGNVSKSQASNIQEVESNNIDRFDLGSKPSPNDVFDIGEPQYKREPKI